ncbi:MAG: type toxin-antitoxin system PemK/MazF family toxin [Ilumatobacteraceae bacterium]|nr:type toxin-antitoxin system PemK/MazF family toxin [Ilumatobacteraceae bacterium]
MRAGDIITVDFGLPAGSGPGFERPAVVVSADLIVAQMPRTFHVVPVTSNVQRALTTDVPISASGLDKRSVGQCHLLTVAELERVKDDGGRGNVGPAVLAQLRAVIADLLDLDAGR